jgi:putative glutamine amidotransferase
MKKTIGIYADTFNGKVGQTFAYMQFFSQFGFVRMISTHENLDNIINEIDILVIPGGADVDATLYGEIPGVNDSRINQHYEYLDNLLIPQFIQANKPIIGIN